MEPVLTARDMTVGYGQPPPFSGLSFEVARGELVGITTLGAADLRPLLDVLAGLEPPAGGEIRWGAVSSLDLERQCSARARYLLERKVRLEVGYLSAAATLLQNRTLEENIALPLVYHDAPSWAQVSATVDRLTARLEIAAEVGRRPAGLPAGVRRRAELARALILKPRLLILDSSVSGMDRATARAMAAALKEHREEGMAVLAATHDPLELAAACTRLLVLAGGRLAGSLSGADLHDRALLGDPEALMKKL